MFLEKVLQYYLNEYYCVFNKYCLCVIYIMGDNYLVQFKRVLDMKGDLVNNWNILNQCEENYKVVMGLEKDDQLQYVIFLMGMGV